MNYSDLLDNIAGRKPNRNTARIDFPLPDCVPGQLYEADCTFRVVSMDVDGTTIEILDLKKETGTPEGNYGPYSSPMKPQAHIIPSPS